LLAQKQSLPALTDSEKIRYSRQLLLPEIGLDGQRRLKAGSVLIIGAGGLGSPTAIYLAAAGVGKIGIVDFDNVELSNLQRQILHDTADVGTSKCQSAKERLNQVNPEVKVVLHQERVSATNIETLIDGYDVVIDATDNFTTRYLVNDACFMANKPNVHGAIYQFEGQSTVFLPGEGPCYRCLFAEAPPSNSIPNCAEGGVLGVLAGMVGMVQATETIKLLVSGQSSLVGKMLMYNALEMRFDKLAIMRDNNCRLCGQTPSIKTISEAIANCPATDQKSGTASGGEDEIEAKVLSKKLSNSEKVFLLDVRNAEEYLLCHLPKSVLIPLAELPERLRELNVEDEIVVYCKSGARSRQAVNLLKTRGYNRTRHLSGGILNWIHEIDPSMPVY